MLAPMPIARTDDVELYYEVHGGGPRRPLLLVMGLGADVFSWDRQLEPFGRERQLVLFDNRGVGRSGKPPGPYAMRAMAADAIAVLDAAGVAEADVLGISMGGMIAQELALAAPGRVGRLVLGATLARPDRTEHETTKDGLQRVGLGLDAIAAGVGARDVAHVNPLEILSFIMPLIFTPEFLMNEQDYLRQMFGKSMQFGYSVPGFVAQLGAVLAHDTLDRLAQIRQPTLVITGTDDRLVPPHHSRTIAARIPGARLVELEGVPHALNVEGHEAFNRAVLAFLDGSAG
jgi:pimeloyl-ACP methyl ester carboxylesterase